MLDNIIGQERVKKILSSVYKSERLSHAYIFYGKEGTGKDAAAVEFAKFINGEEGAGNPFYSQNLHFITALPAGKSDSEGSDDPLLTLDKKDFDLYMEEMELKASDLYHRISIPKANNIRISSIRNIKKSIYLTGNKNKKKVYIISECDKMNAPSANSLLKVLEEPPKNSLLILTTSKINSLPATIVGRCQKIRFDDITPGKLTEYILSKDGSIQEEEAKLFAELSEGSISKCNSIMEENSLELRETAVEFLASLLSGKNINLGEEIGSVISLKDKPALRQFLSLIIIWFRDLIAEKNSIEDIVVNKDKLERLKRFNKKFDSDNYRIIIMVEDAIREIDMNINPELILYNLSFNMKNLISLKP